MTEEELKSIDERLKSLERHKVGHEYLSHKTKHLKRKLAYMEAELEAIRTLLDKKNITKKEENKEPLENISSLTIYNLGLSNRVINCLEYKKIQTIEELLSYSNLQLLNIPKLGQISLNEINIALIKYDLPQIKNIKAAPLSKEASRRATMMKYKF